MTVLAALAVLSSVTLAQAQTCLEQVVELGDTYAMTTDPPDLDQPATAQAPADQPDGEAIENDARSVTEPEVPEEIAGPVDLTTADTVVLESLLVDARGEAERGNEERCMRHLEEARDLLRAARRD